MYRVLCEIYENPPINYVPYINIWGGWLWDHENAIQDVHKIGLRSIKHGARPELIDRKWYWVIDYD